MTGQTLRRLGLAALFGAAVALPVPAIAQDKDRQDKDNKENRELKTALAAIEKEFGKGSIMSLGDMRVLDVPGISTGSLSEITPAELAASGIKAEDFEAANWKAAEGSDGKQYAVPLDIHSIILYYNKTVMESAELAYGAATHVAKPRKVAR